MRFRYPNQHEISPDTPSATTFWSDSPDDSPQDPLMSGTIRDFPRERGTAVASSPNKPSSSQNGVPQHGPSTDIAPWARDCAFEAGSFDAGGLLDKANGRSQGISSVRPGTGQSAASDSPDLIFCPEDRRPSVISATSASSQTSVSKPKSGRRVHNKKLAGFFGEDSRESSKSSDTSIATTGQRDPSISSHSRRNNSVYTNNSTDGRPASGNSSRPRTPPSSDVTPWLFQDFKVRPRVRVCITVGKKSLLPPPAISPLEYYWILRAQDKTSKLQ